jgi:hypothetical protein
MNKGIPEHNPELLPVEVVFAPQWWHANGGFCFDKDFFFHPLRRVEDEQKMETLLWEKWGNYGLGAYRGVERPEQGAVHLAAGYLLSGMLGCEIVYNEKGPPDVVPRRMEALDTRPLEEAFKSPIFKDFETLRESLETKYGYVTGDVNWSGILNLAIDVRGQELFLDMEDDPEEAEHFFSAIAGVIERFVGGLVSSARSSSVSVNRMIAHFSEPLMLHSECSLTMISVEAYRKFLLPHDIRWSRGSVPFGIHYCGCDPHRYAEVFAEIPRLDFLDLGWGGDAAKLRKYLPNTFFNIRLSPVEIVKWTPTEVKENISDLFGSRGTPS